MFCVALQGAGWSAGGLSASSHIMPTSAVPPWPSFGSGAAGGFGAAPDFGGGGVTYNPAVPKLTHSANSQ